MGELCPLRKGRQLQEQRIQGVEWVFCHQDWSRVTAYQLLMVLRKALREVGEEAGSYGTHSFRIGAATEAVREAWVRRT